MPRTIEIQAYKFDELSETAKQRAIESFYDTNVDYEWWDYIYDDAKNVGIKITGFDLDRHKSCEGKLLWNAEAVAEKILEDHGKDCETYKTAKAFLLEMEKLEENARHDYDEYLTKNPIEEERDYFDFDGFYEYEFEDERDSLFEDFEKDILGDYANILQNNYDYLTSEEAIIESIEANEYEFDEDGKQI